MADDKDGRENQAQNEERRQRERAVSEHLERYDEPEPPIDEATLDEVDADLEAVSFPATGSEVVAAVGDREVAASDKSYVLAELLPDADEETFDRPEDVRYRIAKPTIAAAMKRIVEAIDEVPNRDLGRSQRDAYERTFRELKAIDAVDEDEGITVIADWIVERVEQKQDLPGSRDVRRQAAKFCRKQGYSVRNDEWLGV
jgi:hypothetical protein